MRVEVGVGWLLGGLNFSLLTDYFCGDLSYADDLKLSFWSIFLLGQSTKSCVFVFHFQKTKERRIVCNKFLFETRTRDSTAAIFFIFLFVIKKYYSFDSLSLLSLSLYVGSLLLLSSRVLSPLHFTTCPRQNE